jgi:hypothetical protein
MTNLSPQAQAIINAAYALPLRNGQPNLAAALRVLADNVAPENYACFSGHREWDEGWESSNDSIREAILSIATELENL